MRFEGFVEALLSTAQTTAMIFLILLGAAIFNAFLGFSELPNLAAEFFGGSGFKPFTVLLGMIVMYIFLGFVMDSLSMILLTVPIFWPIIIAEEAAERDWCVARTGRDPRLRCLRRERWH